jgi:hypothetical protein
MRVTKQISADTSAHVLYSAATLAQRHYSARTQQRRAIAAQDTPAQSSVMLWAGPRFGGIIIGISIRYFFKSPSLVHKKKKIDKNLNSKGLGNIVHR